jgi:predicted lipoprotein
MDVIRFLQSSAHPDSGADFDVSDTERVWRIDSIPYAQSSALKLAEIALILNQPMTSVVTVDVMHALTTRLADLEAGMRAVTRSGTARAMVQVAPLGKKPDQNQERGTSG